MKYLVLLTTLLSMNALAIDKLVSGKQCTIVYSLNGHSHSVFNEQIAHLSRHLTTKDVQLIDMNRWQNQHPHTPVSGRDRLLLRKRFVMGKGRNTAVVLNKQGVVLEGYEDTVDLVDLLLQCSDGKSSKQARSAVASRQ